MQIILKILTLIILIGIFYNIRQRKKYDEWNEKKNQAIYDLGQILVCQREQATFDVIQALGAVAVEAEAGRYLDDGQVHTLTTQVVMVNSYGQSG